MVDHPKVWNQDLFSVQKLLASRKAITVKIIQPLKFNSKTIHKIKSLENKNRTSKQNPLDFQPKQTFVLQSLEGREKAKRAFRMQIFFYFKGVNFKFTIYIRKID